MLYIVQEKPLVTLFVRKFRGNLNFRRHEVFPASKHHRESFYNQECKVGFRKHLKFEYKWRNIQLDDNTNFTVKIDYRYWVGRQPDEY